MRPALLPRFHLYILGEILRIFAISAVLLTGIGTLGYVAMLAVQGIQSLRLLRIAPLMVPMMMSYALPLAFLAACTLVYSRLVADNEILSLKAAGIPAGNALAPALLLAAALSLLLLWVNDRVAPACEFQKRNIRRALLETLEDYLLAGHRSIDLGDYNAHWDDFRIVADDGRPRWILDGIEFEMREKSNLQRRIRARQGEIYYQTTVDDEGDPIRELRFDLLNAEVLTWDDPKNAQVLTFKVFPLVLPPDRITVKNRKPDEMTLAEIQGELDRQRGVFLWDATRPLRRRLLVAGAIRPAALGDAETEAQTLLRAYEKARRKHVPAGFQNSRERLAKLAADYDAARADLVRAGVALDPDPVAALAAVRRVREPAADPAAMDRFVQAATTRIVAEADPDARKIRGILRGIAKTVLDARQRLSISFCFPLIPPLVLPLCLAAGRRRTGALGLSLAAFLGLFFLPLMGIRALALPGYVSPGLALWLPPLLTLSAIAVLHRRHVRR